MQVLRMSRFASTLLALAMFCVAIPSPAGPLEDSLLASAAARLDVKGIELALRRGAKADGLYPHPDAPQVRKTPVQFALFALLRGAEEPDAEARAERVLRTLFKAGAKLTGDRDELFAPISGGYTQIILLLLDQGANPHVRVYGYLPTELAVKYGRPTLLPIFYARGLPQLDQETVAQISLVRAAGRQDKDAMASALAAGARVDLPDPSGAIALVEVFSMPLIQPDGYDAVKWLLVDAGADASVAEYSETKSTPLHKVIERNSYRKEDHFTTAAIAELLLRWGANVSAVDQIGRTPLHYAASAGNIQAMHVLLRNGAKVQARDALRKSPMDLATSGEAIQLLRDAGARE